MFSRIKQYLSDLGRRSRQKMIRDHTVIGDNGNITFLPVKTTERNGRYTSTFVLGPTAVGKVEERPDGLIALPYRDDHLLVAPGQRFRHASGVYEIVGLADDNLYWDPVASRPIPHIKARLVEGIPRKDINFAEDRTTIFCGDSVAYYVAEPRRNEKLVEELGPNFEKL